MKNQIAASTAPERRAMEKRVRIALAAKLKIEPTTPMTTNKSAAMPTTMNKVSMMSLRELGSSKPYYRLALLNLIEYYSSRLKLRVDEKRNVDWGILV